MAKTIQELETIVDQLSAQVTAKDEELKTYKASMEKQLAELKAESDTDEEKKKQMEAKKAAEEKEQEEKDKQKDAQIMYLANLAKKPRIEALTAAFKSKVNEDILKVYKASWESMNIEQLDAELQKVSIFAPSSIPQSTIPYMPSTPAFVASQKDELSASYEQMSVNELFGGKKA